jgi:two-component system LytT family sensor kinase
MSLTNYIDRQIINKNKGIYFKHSRWIMHVVLILMFSVVSVGECIDSSKDFSFVKVGKASLTIIPFLIFFYYYCLYLLPYCFKLQHYKKFWIQLILLLLIFPAIDFYIQWNIKDSLPSLAKDFAGIGILENIAKTYVSFLSSFALLTAMLYFCELLEEISTVKETEQHNKEHYMAALNRIKTQINPAFMSASLDGIIDLAEAKDNRAAEAVIQFSDVLRYRLYKSKNRLVAIEQEITQLQNLFHLQHSLSDRGCNCNLEIEGNIHEGRMVPLSLITLVEPLFNIKNTTDDISLLMYLLIEEREIQVAIELSVNPSPALDLQFEKIKKDLEQLTYDGINFTLEKDQNNYSLRTCIPTFKNSIA